MEKFSFFLFSILQFHFFLNLTGIRFVNFTFTDPLGGIHSVEESVENVESIVRSGVGVDGSSIPGFASVSRSDVLLVPEVDTFTRLLVQDEEVGLIWCHAETDKGLHSNDPRNILKKQIDRALSMGFTCDMFSELEFYLTQNGIPIDYAKYMDLPPVDKGGDYRHKVGYALERAGVKVKRIHHEVGPAQNEIELQLQPAKKNADDTLIAKWITELEASERGWEVNHLPKPFPGLAGNGLHQHILLRNSKTDVNSMYQNGGLSDIAKHFIAGMLVHSPEILAIFGTHEQTFERLQPGYETPIFAVWGEANRTALVRKPTIGKGSEDKYRVEFRAGDHAGSVHLLCASILAAGLDGIEQKIPCPPPFEGDVYHLNSKEKKKIIKLPNKSNALKLLQKSPWIESILSKPLVNVLANHIKQWNKSWFKKIW